MTTRLAILGNCQAQMLEGMFSLYSPDLRVDRLPPNFQMKACDENAVCATLAGADIVFAQRVAPSYHLPWLTPEGLRAALGSKVAIWPNLYFDGYTPGVHYIYLDDWGKLCSPLEDYHLHEVVDAYRAGADAGKAATILAAGPATDEDSFNASLTELRSRETEVDVPISDYAAQMVATQRCFYTPNHPKNLMLAEMGRRLAAAAGVAFDADAAASCFATRLDRIYIPAAPATVRRYKLRFDHVALYRGVEVTDVCPGQVILGEPRCFDTQALVDQFYRIYQMALSVCPGSKLEKTKV